ncbi:MAG: hypothetical protein M3065_04845 [Actinomycetota bacterium]|nr:hypothetical protein [Actinomycetota bacterium]
MRWRRERKPKRVPGEYPESFIRGFMARALPSASPAEAAGAVRHLRSKGWTEEQLAEFILPYMPRGAQAAQVSKRQAAPGPGAKPRPAAPAEAVLPPEVTRPWLDQHLPALDRYQLRRVVDELEHRGWPTGTVALVVLPYLLPKLPDDDARTIVAGLADLGMTEEEIGRVTTPP